MSVYETLQKLEKEGAAALLFAAKMLAVVGRYDGEGTGVLHADLQETLGEFVNAHYLNDKGEVVATLDARYGREFRQFDFNPRPIPSKYKIVFPTTPVVADLLGSLHNSILRDLSKANAIEYAQELAQVAELLKKSQYTVEQIKTMVCSK